VNCDIFIPVRLSNTRLPQKALKLINGKPVLLYLIERLKSAKKIRKIVVCTTQDSNDDVLVGLLTKENIDYFRGSEKDILQRYLDAANHFGTDYIVSVDGDDIYTDPYYVDLIIEQFEKTNPDYIDMVNFPFGIASVGIKKNALNKLCSLKNSNETETGYRLFFTENTIFNVYRLNPTSDIKFSKNLRLTLDYEEDLVLAKKVFSTIGNNFDLKKLLELFVKQPQLLEIVENLEEYYKQHWNNNVADTSLREE